MWFVFIKDILMITTLPASPLWSLVDVIFQRVQIFWYEFSTDELHTQNIKQNIFRRFISDVELLSYLSDANTLILKHCLFKLVV